MRSTRDIEWQKLEGAEGPAVGLGQLLDTLATAAPKESARAGRSIAEQLFSGGDIFPATVAAAPFLMDVLRIPGFVHKELVLSDLATMAVGLHHDLLTTGLDNGAPAARALFEGKQRTLRAAAREAVARGIELYMDLLRDPDPQVRSQAAFLLAWFPEVPAVLPALVDHVARETQEEPLATALISLGMHVRAARAPSQAASVPALPAGASPLVAFAHGAAEYIGRGPDASLVALARMVPLQVAEPLSHLLFPWDDGHADRYADRLLLDAEDTRGEEAFPFLAQRIEAWPRRVLRILERRFPAPVRSAGELDGPQRRLLEAIAEHDPWWLEVGELRLTMGALGLPDTPEALAAFLGKARPETPLGARVPGEDGAETSLLALLPAISAGLPAEREEALLAGLRARLSPADRVTLAEHVAIVASPKTSALDRFVLALLEEAARDDREVFTKAARRVAAEGSPKVLHQGWYQSSARLPVLYARVAQMVVGGREGQEIALDILLPVAREIPAFELATATIDALDPEVCQSAVPRITVFPGDPPGAPVWALLRRCGSPEAAERLAELVAEWKPQVKHDKELAAAALASGGAAFVPRLLDLAKNKAIVHRDVFVRALGHIADSLAVDALLGLAGDRAEVIQRAWSDALTRLQQALLLARLSEVLSSPDKPTRKAAAQALAALPPSPERSDVASAALASEKDNAIRALLTTAR